MIRLTPNSFGLLIYPCHNAVVREVQLGELELSSQVFTPILREVYDPPVRASKLVVSTDPAAVTPGARREIVDAERLKRVNTDRTYMTAPWPPLPNSILEIRASAPGKTQDVAGTADIPLTGRFDLTVGEADVHANPAKLDEFRCWNEDHPAWQPAEQKSTTG